MLNFVAIADTHLTRQTPLRRTDTDYADTLFRKLEAVVEFAEWVRADAILHAGDLGDHVDWSFRTFNHLEAVMEAAPTMLWVMVPGQHDLYGHRPESLPETPMGALDRRRVSVLQHGGSQLMIDRDNVASVTVHGYGWNDKYMERVVKEGDRHWMSATAPEPAPRILLVHYGITMEDGESIGSDCAVANAHSPEFDLVLSGHWHHPFISEPVAEHQNVPHLRGGTVWACPGALARARADDVERPPTMLHVTVWADDEERLALESTHLPEVYAGLGAVHQLPGSQVWEGHCGTVWGATLWTIPHKPADQVFDLAGIQAGERVDAQAYLAALSNAQQVQDEDDEARVRRVGTAAQFSEPVIDHTVQALPAGAV